MKEKVLLVFSGGMDSTTLLYDLLNQGYEVETLSFDYGQRHNKELEYAKKTCEKLNVKYKIVDISILAKELLGGSSLTDDIDVPEGHYADENMKSTVVPNRNSILLNLAIGYAISQKIYKVGYAAHSGDHAIYPDCRPVFVEKINELAKVVDYEPIQILAPYIGINKGDIAIKGKELNVDYSLSWTCYKGLDNPCGKCGSCVERAEAFEKAGTKDPLCK